MLQASPSTAPPRRARLGRIIAAVGILAFAMAAPGPASATPNPHLLGSDEVRSSDLARFTKWTDMLARYAVEAATADAGCGAVVPVGCPLAYWKQFIESLRGVDPVAQLDRVNRYINAMPYVADARNYDRPDYWATPRQFFDRSGDCEDFAIAKFMSLRALGWSNDRLRILVLDDLDRGVTHAVLVAYHQGEAWLLDNQMERVIRADQVAHYRARYSINETGWWLHRS